MQAISENAQPTLQEIALARYIGDLVVDDNSLRRHLDAPNAYETFIAASQILKRDPAYARQAVALAEAVILAIPQNLPDQKSEEKRASENAVDIIGEIERRGDLASGQVATASLEALFYAGMSEINKNSLLGKRMIALFEASIDAIAISDGADKAIAAVRGLDYEEGSDCRSKGCTRNVTYRASLRKIEEFSRLAA